MAIVFCVAKHNYARFYCVKSLVLAKRNYTSLCIYVPYSAEVTCLLFCKSQIIFTMQRTNFISEIPLSISPSNC